MATNVDRGAALKAAREAKPWTQAQLAAAAGVSTRTVIRAELGGDATAETLLALCGALGIDSTELPKADHPVAPGYGLEDDIPPSPPEPSATPARARLGSALRRGGWALGLAALCAATWHVSWAAAVTYGNSEAPTLEPLIERTLALNLATDMMRAGRAVAEGSPPRTTSWDGLFERRAAMSTPFECPNKAFLDFLLGEGWGTGRCRMSRSYPSIAVEAAGPALVNVTIGPVGPTVLGGLARMLPKDPRLMVTARYSETARPARWGALWFEPAALDKGQVPAPSMRHAYLQVRIEAKEQGR